MQIALLWCFFDTGRQKNVMAMLRSVKNCYCGDIQLYSFCYNVIVDIQQLEKINLIVHLRTTKPMLV